jgi:hypothetical protein
MATVLLHLDITRADGRVQRRLRVLARVDHRRAS